MSTSTEPTTDRRTILRHSIVGSPTDEEVAAILAAVEVTTPRAVFAPGPQGPPPWRFSGRWWRRPVAARRERPW